ncbi:MAG: hypothetical protein KKB79_01605 [Nanoarchaeota archaeon]|nr:hypothetical protein [Nanoarchaeota archaeon]
MNKKASFSEVFLWLSIFVVGSLIVSWVISPESLNPLENRIRSIGHSIASSQDQEDFDMGATNTNDGDYISQEINFDSETKKTSQNLERVNTYYPYDSCSIYETKAEMEGLEKDRLKETMCSVYCGQKDMEYYSFECIKDQLYCDCLKEEEDIEDNSNLISNSPDNNLNSISEKDFEQPIIIQEQQPIPEEIPEEPTISQEQKLINFCTSQFLTIGIFDLKNTGYQEDFASASNWIRDNYENSALTQEQKEHNINYIIEKQLPKQDYPIVIVLGSKNEGPGVSSQGFYYCNENGVI